jgi:hypothetical protein
VGALGIGSACEACSNLLLQHLVCCSCICLLRYDWHINLRDPEHRASDRLSCEGVVLQPGNSLEPPLLLLLLLLLLRSA